MSSCAFRGVVRAITLTSLVCCVDCRIAPLVVRLAVDSHTGVRKTLASTSASVVAMLGPDRGHRVWSPLITRLLQVALVWCCRYRVVCCVPVVLDFITTLRCVTFVSRCVCVGFCARMTTLRCLPPRWTSFVVY